MVTQMSPEARQGYFSLLRWRSDVTRDEERNIGVVLLDPGSGQRALRPMPVSRLSSKLHEQGILDAALATIRESVEQDTFTVDDLADMHRSFTRSLLVSEPQPIAVSDVDATLGVLYKTFVSVRGGGGTRSLTKGAVTDRVVDQLRHRGWRVKRGAYLQEFIFDLVVEQAPGVQNPPSVMGILSFGSERKDWSPVEMEAGHFAFGVEQLSLQAVAAILPPASDASSATKRSHERVRHMLDRAAVQTRDVNDYLEPRTSLPVNGNGSHPRAA